MQGLPFSVARLPGASKTCGRAGKPRGSPAQMDG